MRAAAKVLAALVVLCSLASAQITVIKAGHLVDVDAGVLLDDQTIVIRHGKIEAVGKGLAIPAGAEVIDLSSMTVLPGLIDCHTHLADGARESDPLSQIKKSAAQSVLESVPNARLTLESGFTTVRDVGVYRALNDVALRDAINHGYVIGPRMFVAGGGHHDCWRCGGDDGSGCGCSIAAGYAAGRGE